MARNRGWLLAGGLAILLMAFVLVCFEPQQLFIDDLVVEPVPTVSSPTTTDAPGTPVPPTSASPKPIVLREGSFVSRDHGTSGLVRVLELEDGSHVVRLEGLDTDNGPDLYVYLTTNPADGPEGAFDDDHHSLGRLKGNLGDQNYELAAEVDLSRYRSVVIWCDRFNSAFGAADLG